MRELLRDPPFRRFMAFVSCLVLGSILRRVFPKYEGVVSAVEFGIIALMVAILLRSQARRLNLALKEADEIDEAIELDRVERQRLRRNERARKRRAAEKLEREKKQLEEKALAEDRKRRFDRLIDDDPFEDE